MGAQLSGSKDVFGARVMCCELVIARLRSPVGLHCVSYATLSVVRGPAALAQLIQKCLLNTKAQLCEVLPVDVNNP